MFALSKLWRTEKEEKSVQQQICDVAIDTVMDAVKDIYPSIQSEVQSFVSNKIAEHKEKFKESLDTTQLFSYSLDLVYDYLQSQDDDIEKLNMIERKIEIGRELVDDVDDYISNDEDSFDAQFKKRVEFCKKFTELSSSVKNKKKKLRILVLGQSQAGKTSTAKRIFRQKSIKIKYGIESDTSDVTEYVFTVNGIQIIYYDTPGFFDTRGIEQDVINFSKIIDFIKNTKIDFVFWVAKIGDVCGSHYKKLLYDLSNSLGVDIWSKTIIILTCANGNAPDKFYENKKNSENSSESSFSDADEFTELDHIIAWKKYTKKKKQMWTNIFEEFLKEYYIANDIPLEKMRLPSVALTENEKSYLEGLKINGVYYLRDRETPILETIMTYMFERVNKNTAPITFMALIGNQKNKPINEPKNENVYSGNKSSPVKISKKNKPSEHAIAANNAVNKVIKFVNKSEPLTEKKENSWCVIL